MAVGISDIAIYLPRQMIEIQTVIDHRSLEEDGVKVGKLLTRALKRTGLTSLHFPKSFEDPVTMAAEATLSLLKRNRFPLSSLRYLATGTETSVDHSKPLASYVMGALKKAQMSLPTTVSTFQTQHACAGGTLALLGIAALLQMTADRKEAGLVICSDIARYEKRTSAEVTQGAGSVCLLVESSPQLIELDLQNAGFCSNDVDDFFRPLGSETAKVKGSFSIQCYKEAMEGAFLDVAKRKKQSIQDLLKETDLFALHVPYPNLPLETMHYLLGKYLELSKEDADFFLQERGFFAMTAPAAKSGNIYSGSLFMSLSFLLEERFKTFGNSLVGKKILLGSYGSGNTLAAIPGVIAKNAPSVITSWNLERIFEKENAPISAYENWLNKEPLSHKVPSQQEFPVFALQNIRSDGYREYHYYT
jgi:hydroxymethylglutaryl-CoA synthase